MSPAFSLRCSGKSTENVFGFLSNSSLFPKNVRLRKLLFVFRQGNKTVSFLKTGVSAIGKLLVVGVLGAAFLGGLLGVVYLSLRGEEIPVPEIVGKDFSESEKELTQLGLKIKKRATRYSQEKPNTVLEQSPKSGTIAKTGQQILVVVSQVNPESTEAPATVDKPEEETDSGSPDASDKPKKTNKNANVKKPAQTSRDVSSNKPAKTEDSNTATSPSNKSDTKSNTSTGAPVNKSGTTSPSPKPATPSTSKPNANRPPTGGDSRTRRVPN